MNQNSNQPTFHYTVDGEPHETHKHVMTATEILQSAGLDPTQYYLKQIQGDHEISYKPNEEIRMHNHMKFISIFTGSTPVSWRY